MRTLETGIIYGPVRSRRFGWDLGINLLPANRKLCTFDCIYCQYGFTGHGSDGVIRFPDIQSVLNGLEERLAECEKIGMRIRHTTIAGNGEPTMHPEFAYLAERLIHWRNENAPWIRFAILSNGYRIHLPEIRYTLGLFEEPILKLDAGDSIKLGQINQPLVRMDLPAYLENLKKCSHVILQTMFLKGWNDGIQDLASWMKAVAEVRPESAQIYTLDRNPAMPGLQPLSNEALQKIARDTSVFSGVPVHAYL